MNQWMEVQQFQGQTFSMILFLLLSVIVSGDLMLDSSDDGKTYIVKSYFEKNHNFMELEFTNFIANDVPLGLSKVLQDKNYDFPAASVLRRSVVGDGSHRHLSSSIRLDIQRDLRSELAANSCSLIIIEKLPSGVFADPFELQRLVQKNVFSDAGVFGDTNLELPSFRSNQSVVEIHMTIATLLESSHDDDLEVKSEVPLHARYPPLGHGFSKVEFGEPDLFMCCWTEGKTVGKRCLRMPTNFGHGFEVTWEIPCGNKEHAGVVSAVTFGFAVVAAFIVVITSICYSDNTVSNKSKYS